MYFNYPKVHEVNVNETVIIPDPIVIQQNDIVAWIFQNPHQYNVVMLETVEETVNSTNVENTVDQRLVTYNNFPFYHIS